MPNGRQFTAGTRVTFTYDAAGRRTQMVDPRGTSTFQYDAADQLEVATNVYNKTVTYTYDPRGFKASLQEPFGGRFTFSYDAAGRNQSVINPQNERTTFVHDATNRKLQDQLANGARASFTYDAAGQTLQLFNLRANNSVISSFDYAYDAAGNRTRVVESDGTRVTWTYDETNQLTREQRSGTNAYDDRFTYDPVGNRTLLERGVDRVTTTYDAADQIVTKLDSSGVTTYTYDGAGNETGILEPTGALTTQMWDDENHLTRWQVAADQHDYFYNGTGERLRTARQVGVDSRFVWDGANILVETNDAGNQARAIYTLEPSLYGNVISARRAQTVYHHFDALGSTRSLTNAAANVTDTYIYRAFGELLASTGATPNNYRWVGQVGYFTDGDAPIYVRARCYDPIVGRWLSADPAHDRLSGSLYEFVHSSPVIIKDPSGLEVHLGCTPILTDGMPLLGTCHCGIIQCCNGKCMRIDGMAPEPPGSNALPIPIIEYSPDDQLLKDACKQGKVYEVASPFSNCGQEGLCLGLAFAGIKQLPWFKLGPNSNTYAHALLEACGLKFKPNQWEGGIVPPHSPFEDKTGFTPPCAVGWDHSGYFPPFPDPKWQDIPNWP